MPIAAHRCTLSYVAGNFGTTGDALALVSGTTYAPTTARKNVVINPNDVRGVNQFVKVGGVSIGTAYTVNTLAGQFTLNSPPGGAVTADFGYWVVSPALEVREFSVNLTRDELEDTVFGDNAKSYTMGLKNGTGTIGGLDILSTLFIDLAGFQRSIESIHENDYPFVLSFTLNPDARRVFRAFVKIPSLDLSGARDGLVEGSFPFTITEITAEPEATGKASYSFFTAVL